MLQGPPFLTDKQHIYGDGVSVNPLTEALIRVAKARHHLRRGQHIVRLDWCFGLVMPSVDMPIVTSQLKRRCIASTEWNITVKRYR